ncbi:hypothetical protein OG339_48830 (plasmid) [Streptosporangium sp. NBC_01495]|uniref:hypothetical protein n=1 Tax=Streptosporangium sp. NBC_01495 TaxID=2903899 RepID=UPI002E2FFB27|nr:hypothetical protein [Streptosporangium sp. NBC_01495]
MPARYAIGVLATHPVHHSVRPGLSGYELHEEVADDLAHWEDLVVDMLWYPEMADGHDFTRRCPGVLERILWTLAQCDFATPDAREQPASPQGDNPPDPETTS